MTPPIRAVFFDVDGVLVDSLQAHLEICKAKSEEFGLNLKIPTALEIRTMVRRGVVISPMKYFFLAVGFPEQLADQADADYKREFADRYRATVFQGVAEMLANIANGGIPMGLVTANTRAIVESTLGACLDFFLPDGRFTVDDTRKLTKSQALSAGAQLINTDVSSIIYIGDQPKDYEAARNAHTQFLGVTYGWGISGDEQNICTARTPSEVADFVIARRKS